MLSGEASSLWALALPVWAGVSFSLIGIAYQMGKARDVSPLRVFLMLSLVGTAFFGIKSMGTDLGTVPMRHVLLGAVCGAAQYATMRLVSRAVKLGPFSPIWCVLSLGFAPVVIYAASVQGAVQSAAQWSAVALATACCVVAATSLPAAPEHGQRPSVLAYGTLLLVILALNATLNVAIQDLTVATPGVPRDVFFLLMYAGIAIACFVDAVRAREVRQTLRRGWWPGVVAGFGSVSGMLALGLAAERSGAQAFLICSMVTLILPLIAAVSVFHERPSVRWALTLVLGVTAIVLANG